METFFRVMDSVIMPLYGVMADPILGFYLGTFSLAAASFLIGEVTFMIALLWNRKHLMKKTGEMVRLNNLSIEALQSSDGDSYRACNKLANESFGQVFFMQFTLSAAALWPAPLALAWMQRHFMNVEFSLPFVSASMGFAGIFILFYILSRILLGKLKTRLPFAAPALEVMKSIGAQTSDMKSWQELFPRKDKSVKEPPC